jgi:hypothetical protein
MFAQQLPLLSAVLTTTGSTKAVQSSPSSNNASTNEIVADPRRIRTSWSLNCSSTNFHKGVGGSSGSELLPYFCREVATWSLDRPDRSVTSKYFKTSAVLLRKAFSMVEPS